MSLQSYLRESFRPSRSFREGVKFSAFRSPPYAPSARRTGSARAKMGEQFEAGPSPSWRSATGKTWYVSDADIAGMTPQQQIWMEGKSKRLLRTQQAGFGPTDKEGNKTPGALWELW